MVLLSVFVKSNGDTIKSDEQTFIRPNIMQLLIMITDHDKLQTWRLT